MSNSPPTWSPRFGQHLEAARTRALLSRAQLALRLGVAEETIRRWERGGARPTTESLVRLIVVLSLDEAELGQLPAVRDETPPLGRRLREERRSRGITQAAAGRILGVAQPTYAGWEVGRAAPEAKYLPGIATFLGVSRVEIHGLVFEPFVVDTSHWPPLGRLLGRRRQELRLTRDELADAIGVATATVTAWELGYRTPRPHHVRQIAATIDVSAARLDAALPHRQQLSALGLLVRSRQQTLGLRLGDIAERARIDVSTLSRWIHGHHAPTAASLRRLASALEVPLPVVREVAGLAG